MNGWAHGAWGVVWMALFWAVLVALVYSLIRGGRRDDSATSRQSADEILAERFARGEISEEEYRERLSVLRRTP